MSKVFNFHTKYFQICRKSKELQKIYMFFTVSNIYIFTRFASQMPVWDAYYYMVT
jgi:hypothetical protein